jgi:rare lipoprotein A (peptidoglycan hydrolase)
MPIYAFLVAGIASWFYPASMYASTDHVCAMNVAPPGTAILIVDEDNRRTATCTVIGTGPFVPGRVLDVSPAVRDELGMDAAGTASVRVYRVTGRIPPCRVDPQPVTCKTPPAECVADLPKPALLLCAKM